MGNTSKKKNWLLVAIGKNILSLFISIEVSYFYIHLWAFGSLNIEQHMYIVTKSGINHDILFSIFLNTGNYDKIYQTFICQEMQQRNRYQWIMLTQKQSEMLAFHEDRAVNCHRTVSLQSLLATSFYSTRSLLNSKRETRYMQLFDLEL